MPPRRLPCRLRWFAGLACVCGSAVLTAAPARAQDASVATPPAPDDAAEEAEGEDDPFRFAGRGVYVGAGAGMVPEVGEAAFASRIQLVFPVAVEWFGIEIGLLGQAFTVTDHHGDRIDVDTAAITTGARFALPLDAPFRPYGAARVAHVHFFPDPFGEHGHAGADGAEHVAHDRWGVGGALGVETGIPSATSRFRVAIEAEVLALTGEGVNVVGQAVALLGVGF